MTREEWCAVDRWLDSLSYGAYQLALADINAFAHSEFGKPRPPGDWRSRFAAWKKQQEGGAK